MPKYKVGDTIKILSNWGSVRIRTILNTTSGMYLYDSGGYDLIDAIDGPSNPFGLIIEKCNYRKTKLGKVLYK